MKTLKITAKAETEYQKFFQKKLDEHGVNSPAELNDEEKKKFFNEIETEWTGEKSESAKRNRKA